MSKSNIFENEFLAHVFQNARIGDIGDATGLPAAATAGNLYISLHTQDPDETGNQSTNECTYTGYARVAMPRNSTTWPITNNAVSCANPINFPTGTGGSGTATHFGIGTSATGTGKLLYKGPLSPTIVTGNGVTPQIAAGVLVTEE